ncbi:hypothetical protein SEA_VANLEE_56 [Gordonia phage VanLee]|uniref:Uncharacterized protein n=1 Tax=Gordonia phage VanLee TaxID=2845816 RepID=A0A8F2D9P5_9CAUD|nr:hypothetical protein QEH49_gp056 [Gordonia phage VanLee]QWS68173.1 hypothetical protein SEA_VANLEE_56 [Gordonia phage VanLee]
MADSRARRRPGDVLTFDDGSRLFTRNRELANWLGGKRLVDVEPRVMMEAGEMPETWRMDGPADQVHPPVGAPYVTSGDATLADPPAPSDPAVESPLARMLRVIDGARAVVEALVELADET